MLPLGVLARKLMADPAGRNRLLGAMVAMVFLVGAFATGLSVNIEFGDTGDDAPLALTSTIDPSTGEQVFVDDEGNAVDEQQALAAGARPSTGTKSAAGSSTASNTSSAAPSSSGGSVKAGAATSPETSAAGEPAGAAAPAQANADPCDGAQLAATDQGVSKESIKLGFLISDLGPLASAGFDVGASGDYQLILDAWMNELNANGGVACREVTYVTESFDVLSVDDMNAKCKAMTEDHKVFSVLTTGGYDSVAQLCVAKDHQTPFLNPEAEPAHWYREASPYLWNLLMSKDRMHRNHVRLLVEEGEIDPSTKVGVVYHGIPNVGPSVEAGLLPELKANGITPEKVVKLSSDDERAISEINQVVLEFNTAGIDYVFMPMNLIFKTQFMQTAEQQNYFPSYTDSDHYYGCFDFVTETYPARSWDKTKCVTANTVVSRPDLDEYVNNHPFAQYADQVYLRTNPDGYDAGGEKDEEAAEAQRALHQSVGSLLLLWSQAADRVGPELTRPAWGEAMGQTGAFDKCVCEHPLTFGAQKWGGPDHIKIVQWHAEAGGGFEERMYRELTRPRPAFY